MNTNKINLTISCPVDTYSGYGARARDFIKGLIKLDKYNIKILAQNWGNTRWGYLEDHKETELSNLIVPTITEQPDIWIQHTVPNEFKKIGKFNIGLTAGIETTICDPSWIEGVNKMDLIIVSSQHAKDAFNRSIFDLKDDATGKVTKTYKVTTPIEVLFEGLNEEVYTPKVKGFEKTEIYKTLNNIPEQFCYLSTGHWMQGKVGEDRKNIGLTIKTFLETFRNKSKQPALILKSHTASTSIMDRNRMLAKIEEVTSTVVGKLPNIYLLHGEITDGEMNILYNHPKVKALVSLTKGEGFGRPLLEFSFVNKPIIVSSWSGHTDFLDSELTKFIPGTLETVDETAVVEKTIIKESSWFSPNPVEVRKAFKEVYNKYKDWEVKAKKQGYANRKTFTISEMTDRMSKIFNESVPTFVESREMKLPELNLPKI